MLPRAGQRLPKGSEMKSIDLQTRIHRRDISQTERVLGYLPLVDLEEGLRRTAAYYKAEHK
jgi:nucleoside-diphosphate-sugar epimerase